MVIKINKKGKSLYKSSQIITTSEDVKRADVFDLELSRKFKEIEGILKKEKLIAENKTKNDPLRAWYIIGKNINKFLDAHKSLTKEDKDLFWEYLYGRSHWINKKTPLTKVSPTRNDFVTASILARYSFNMISDVGSWGLWREIIGYRLFLKDERLLKWLIDELKSKPRTRDDARPLLKAVFNRFKKVETTVLKDKELLKLLESIK